MGYAKKKSYVLNFLSAVSLALLTVLEGRKWYPTPNTANASGTRTALPGHSVTSHAVAVPCWPQLHVVGLTYQETAQQYLHY